MRKQVVLISVLLPALTLMFAVAIAAGYDGIIPASSMTNTDTGQAGGTNQQDKDWLTSIGLGIYNNSPVTSTVYLPIVMKSPGLCFSDDFSDPQSGWYIGDSGDVWWRYFNGEYEILLRNPDWWAGATAVVSPLTNYSVEVDVHRNIGFESDYGIIFDLKNWDNFYIYAIDPSTQFYGVVKIDDGNVEDIIPLTYSNFINPFNETNHLMVERDGDKIDIFINGGHLGTAFDVGFDGNNEVGLFVESDDSSPSSARYDNFEVWCPNPGTTTSGEYQSTQVTSSAAAGSIFFDD